ncbi:MAG: HAMP domain-containing protein, partial [Oscillospiraceae bacterium]|nr:HAMP domain-containing protein [Oscillospiraceae bacterium]
SVQLLLGVLYSLLTAVAVFAMVYCLGNLLLDHTVYGRPFARKLSERRFNQLQNYVALEQITKENLRGLNPWFYQRKDAYLLIYQDNEKLYESPANGNLLSYGDENASNGYGPDEKKPDFPEDACPYSLTLSDGVTVQAYLYYSASDAFYIWMVVVSALLAFIVFSLLFISLVHRKLRYIQRLRSDLNILAGGDLTYPVTVRGADELGELASGIEEMRRSILSHQRAEDEMRSANSRLVTAMSHDLRNPLTSLMAYLELLDRDKIADEEQRRHLIRQSLIKAQSMKAMADKLFEYFLVYTTEWEQPDMELLDADELFRQICQEYAFSLENQGFSVQTNFPQVSGSVAVNLQLLHRAFDNLYSNLLKYAEPSKPIEMSYHQEQRRIFLRIVNDISPFRDCKESNNIGLNTCRRIIKMHGGEFEFAEDGGKFAEKMILPLVGNHCET